MPERAPAAKPWRPEQELFLITGLGVSALVLLAGWVGASGQAGFTDQYPWITLAIIGVAASGVVQARWLLAGFVAVRRLQHEVLAGVTGTDIAPPPAAVPTDDLRTVVVGAGTRYHRTDCAMVKSKPVQTGTADQFNADGLTACGLCSACEEHDTC